MTPATVRLSPHLLLLVILRQWLIIAVLKLGSLLYDRASPCLKNLQIIRQQLKPYKPQKQYLSLIGTGDRCERLGVRSALAPAAIVALERLD